MIKYVVGFAFDNDYRNILLIRKNRPKWQKGKLNGIGGKIKLFESNINAMVREFEEECGLKTNHLDWIPLMVISGKEWKVYFYYTELTYLSLAKTTTDEEVINIPMDKFYDYKDDVLPNLLWLVPMAIDKDPRSMFIF